MTPVTTTSPGSRAARLISAVGLQLFAQRLSQRVAQPWLQGLVIEGQHFDGLFAGHRAIDRAQLITGAAGQ